MTHTSPRAAKRTKHYRPSILKCLFDLASGETLIAQRQPYENDGLIIFARATWVALVVVLISETLSYAASIIRIMCETNPVFSPLPLSLTGIVLSILSWLKYVSNTYGSLFLSVFGGSYVALYARFASQWNYLADLYNQIKSKEIDVAGSPDCKAQADREAAIKAIDAEATNSLNCNQAYLLAQWKCGFIEDAFTVHLAKKKLFADVIANWAQDEVTRRLLQRKDSSFAKEALGMPADIAHA